MYMLQLSLSIARELPSAVSFNKSTMRFAQVPQRSGAHRDPMGAPMGPRAQNRDFYWFFWSKRAGRHPRGTGGAVGVTCEDIAANGCLRVRVSPIWIFPGTFQRPFLAGKRPGGSQHTWEPPGTPPSDQKVTTAPSNRRGLTQTSSF